jgi:hypothetical protein
MLVMFWCVENMLLFSHTSIDKHFISHLYASSAPSELGSLLELRIDDLTSVLIPVPPFFRSTFAVPRAELTLKFYQQQSRRETLYGATSYVVVPKQEYVTELLVWRHLCVGSSCPGSP